MVPSHTLLASGTGHLGAEDLRERLHTVVDPELGADIVELGMVRDITVSPDGRAEVSVALTIAGCPLRRQIEQDIRTALADLVRPEDLTVTTAAMNTSEKRTAMAVARRRASLDSETRSQIPSTARVLAIASGKGGVGKSSVSVGLAWALAERGLTVGLLDADIWGFSVPRMIGVSQRLEPEGTPESWTILPQELKVGAGLLKVVSMGLLADSEDGAIMWRGLILNRAFQHFIEDVRWAPLDYLVIDMPPGTGDIQMGLARMLPRASVVVVTTPSSSAAGVASRVGDMARKGHLRVAGVVENMSSFTCQHGEEYRLFGEGGGKELSLKLGVPLLAQLPFEVEAAIAHTSDKPLAESKGLLSKAIEALAERMVEEVAPELEMSGCSARLLERVRSTTA